MEGNDKQRIGRKAVKALRCIVYDEENLSILLSEENENDYGVDFHGQFLRDENHEGEFFKVQLKGCERKLEPNKDGLISFQLKNGEYKNFLQNKVKDVLMLIVVDNVHGENKKIYYHPIQTLVNDTITMVYIDPDNVLEDNYESWNKFVSDLGAVRLFLSEKNIVTESKRKSLSESIEMINRIEEEALSVPGYRLVKHPDPNTKYPFEMVSTDGSKIFYEKGPDWTEDHSLSLSLSMSKNQYNDLINAQLNGQDFDFDGKFQEKVKERILTEGEGLISMKTPKEILKLIIGDMEHSITLLAEKTASEEELIISTIQQEIFAIDLSIIIPIEGDSVIFGLNFKENLDSFTKAYNALHAIMHSNIYFQRILSVEGKDQTLDERIKIKSEEDTIQYYIDLLKIMDMYVFVEKKLNINIPFKNKEPKELLVSINTIFSILKDGIAHWGENISIPNQTRKKFRVGDVYTIKLWFAIDNLDGYVDFGGYECVLQGEVVAIDNESTSEKLTLSNVRAGLYKGDFSELTELVEFKPVEINIT